MTYGSKSKSTTSLSYIDWWRAFSNHYPQPTVALTTAEKHEATIIEWNQEFTTLANITWPIRERSCTWLMETLSTTFLTTVNSKTLSFMTRMIQSILPQIPIECCESKQGLGRSLKVIINIAGAFCDNQ